MKRLNRKKLFKSNTRKVLALVLTIIVLFTSIRLDVFVVNAEEIQSYVTLYLIDNTSEKWLSNDDALIELVDNSSGHDRYMMTKVNSTTWSVNVPESAYNITFNRYNQDKTIQWNSWSAGGRDSNNAYYIDGSEYGRWEVFEEYEDYFHAGEIIFLDLSDFNSWQNDNALMYVNFSDASKEENYGNDVNFIKANKMLYNPMLVEDKIDEYIYAYIVTKQDEGATELRFWRGNNTTLWNCSVLLSYNQYKEGINCIRITEWNESGIIESSKNEINYEKDSDGDGVFDYFEAILGLDKHNGDTDGDGLTDFQELSITLTDPMIYDSVSQGISDAYIDNDGDGISNIQEINLGTDPNSVDTDGDKLTDSDEINIYKTNPTIADTDKDGIDDGDEIVLGLNPNLKDTDKDGIDDGDEYIEQLVDKSRYDESLFEDNLAIPSSLIVSAKGNVNSNICVTKYTGDLKGDERVYIGNVIEITNSDINNGKLSFALSDEYVVKSYEIDGVESNGLLICYNNRENTVPLSTTYDAENRTISADISSDGIYFVLDVMEWIETLSLELPVENTSYVNQNIQTFSMEEILNLDTSIANIPIKGQVDIVFMIDTTGSMGGYISNVKNNIIAFVDEIENAGITPSFALIDYRDITCDGQYSTNVKQNNGSNWFKNSEDLKNAISNLTVSGGGDTPETPIDALEMARQLDLRASSQKFFVLVTDAGYKVDNNYGIKSMNEMIELLEDDNINVSVVSNSSYISTYRPLYEMTGGIFANVSGNFKNELLSIADMINDETNSGCWIALNGLVPQIVKLEERPTTGSNADTDKDSLLDVEELKSVEPTKILDVNLFLHILGLPFEYEYSTIPVYDYYSSPVKIDTDNDEIYDNRDTSPRKSNDYAATIKNYINKELVDMNTIKETDDNFLICTTSIADILCNAGISEVLDNESKYLDVRLYYDDWYIFVVNNNSPTFGLFKMREQENDNGDNDDPGVTVSFISFDIAKLNSVLFEGKTYNSELYDEIDKVVRLGLSHNKDIQKYFSDVSSEGSYIIAEAYAEKIADLSTCGLIDFPNKLNNIYNKIEDIDKTIEELLKLPSYDNLTLLVLYKNKGELSRVPNALKSINTDSGIKIVDEKNRNILLANANNLSYYEKIAILSAFTADISFNMFAAEVKAHSDYLVNWISDFKDWPVVGGFVESKWYSRAIRADMAIGEEYESGYFDEYYDVDSKLIKEQIEYHGKK